MSRQHLFLAAGLVVFSIVTSCSLARANPQETIEDMAMQIIAAEKSFQAVPVPQLTNEQYDELVQYLSTKWRTPNLDSNAKILLIGVEIGMAYDRAKFRFEIEEKIDRKRSR